MSAYIDRGIGNAERAGARAVVIELDTPGGLDTAMREIMQRIIGAQVPVIVYVSPPGGRAASAGLFITQAGHVAAMAPNTNIGSAHAVAVGLPGVGEGQPDPVMMDKVTNDAVALIRGVAETRNRNMDWVEKAVRESVNVPAKDALELNVIDLVAPDLPSLLQQVDGRTVVLGSGQEVTLATKDAALHDEGMNFVEDFLHKLSDPTVASILMLIGINGLIFELASPGAILPGVVGGIALLLALFGLGMLPVNFAGLLFIALAFLLFVADVMMPTHGILTAGAIISLLLGSMILLSGTAPYFAINWPAILTAIAATAAFFAFAVTKATRAQRRRVATGREGMIGTVGTARTALAPKGMVFVHGEYWEAKAENGHLVEGDRVQVVGVDGLHLVVRKV
jgi:membrane-bound serine protease (ClpP class)